MPNSTSQPYSVQPLLRALLLPVSGRWLPNRILEAALTKCLASWEVRAVQRRGIPTADLHTLYTKWADGQFRMIITGNIMMDHINLEAAGNIRISQENDFSGPRFEAFRSLVSDTKLAIMIGQLNHPGRQVKSMYQPHPIGASDVTLESGNELRIVANRLRAANSHDLSHIVSSFAHAAVYLEQAGLDGVQLHVAHGYLLGQFLSLITNKRTDEHGISSMQDRARLICEVAAAIWERTKPGFILGIKINSVGILRRADLVQRTQESYVRSLITAPLTLLN